MIETDRIPLFPLGIVVLPGMAAPLHIFEERYKQMIARCRKNEEDFGVIYYDGSNMAAAGCTVRITKIAKEYGDGRLDIITLGQRRFEVEKLHDQKAYFEATITYFDDEFEADNERIAELAQELKTLLKKLFKMHSQNPDFRRIELLDARSLSFLTAFHDAFSPQEKQRFLETRYLGERLEKGVRVIQKIIERVKINKDINKIIHNNGYMPNAFPK